MYFYRNNSKAGISSPSSFIENTGVSETFWEIFQPSLYRDLDFGRPAVLPMNTSRMLQRKYNTRSKGQWGEMSLTGKVPFVMAGRIQLECYGKLRNDTERKELTRFGERFHFSQQLIGGLIDDWNDVFQLSCGERWRESVSNTPPRIIAGQEKPWIQGRGWFYDGRPIRELPKLLHHDLFDYLGVGYHNGGRSTDAATVHAAVLVEVV